MAGLWAGVVHGAASAGSAQLALATANGMGIDVKPLNFRALGAVLIAASLSSMFAFLRQSPLPRPEDDTNVWRASNTGAESPVDLVPAPSGGGAPVTPKSP